MLETRLPISRMSLYLLFYPGLDYVITAACNQGERRWEMADLHSDPRPMT